MTSQTEQQADLLPLARRSGDLIRDNETRRLPMHRIAESSLSAAFHTCSIQSGRLMVFVVMQELSTLLAMIPQFAAVLIGRNDVKPRLAFNSEVGRSPITRKLARDTKHSREL